MIYRGIVLYYSTQQVDLLDFLDRHRRKEHPVRDQNGKNIGSVRNLRLGTKAPVIVADLNLDPTTFNLVASTKAPIQQLPSPRNWDRVYKVFVPYESTHT
jgi:hypothetical protein